ncbi:hypothetical protein [Erwinia rhapontici]
MDCSYTFKTLENITKVITCPPQQEPTAGGSRAAE